MDSHLFTSESVGEGHPDKMADQISDAILDGFLLRDPSAKVACECLLKSDAIVLAGEISSSATFDIEQVVHRTIEEIGYDSADKGFDAKHCRLINLLGQQSLNISDAIRAKDNQEQGAGDQGITYGYACDETPEYMPAALLFAHRLMQRHAFVRKSHTLDFLLPDAKSQVSLRFNQRHVIQAQTVVLSTQHHIDISQKQLQEAVIEEIIKPVLPNAWLKHDTQLLVNPAGPFVIGGPAADCGLTGRKIIVDTYGGAAHHGGGAFSGKDPSKVDRSGAYVARYIAKNIVAAGLASQCEIQLAWAIGVPAPISIDIQTFGSETIAKEKILGLIQEHFELSVYQIIQHLDLLTPRYRKTACYGHFGRNIFPWEKIDKAEQLREDAHRANCAA
ncbi:methionine adenosyltransferase [Celerinatantimonas sp. MCCC 1A17872]|uniref:methionine adenosyltransferase n=1 Tax=Celerinatantimonas sp. MCCC 1A17872 TaxID=3177514 RepID=UPI0038C1D8BF